MPPVTGLLAALLMQLFTEGEHQPGEFASQLVALLDDQPTESLTVADEKWELLTTPTDEPIWEAVVVDDSTGYIATWESRRLYRFRSGQWQPIPLPAYMSVHKFFLRKPNKIFVTGRYLGS